MKWSEKRIASALARQVFDRRSLVMLPNCSWTGSECDLLVVTNNLRIIDVEIKISRSDFKADAKKAKWWRSGTWIQPAARGLQGHYEQREPLQWPPKVWKHYYAMPKEIWKPELVDLLPSEKCGVILLSTQGHDDLLLARIERRSAPCRDAEPINAVAAIDLARLASLRMWDAFDKQHENVLLPLAARKEQP